MKLKNTKIFLVTSFLIISNTSHTKLILTEIKKEDLIYKNINLLRPNLKESLKVIYSDLIRQHCIEPTQLHMVAIFEQESGFRSYVRNHNDYGLGQINLPTWNKFFNIKNKEKLYNPILNIEYSCKILELAYNSHYKKHANNYYLFYHSWNSKPQKKYKERVNKILERMQHEI